ncbi:MULTISPECIES: tetratricopeptide repeat-containing glycosyltransferase family protein [unclassified Synechococcus]|uniref:tetratricopeptide repeat-containing glycosyltransferase family protein n=1 Tax=unclassified Synechococcus TaxID=2626047 RepID=UPI001C22FA58|nr:MULTISPECIES: tetratricopeptide repeat-containing glycosyltransferase family protein [unclassified Synechococcus]
MSVLPGDFDLDQVLQEAEAAERRQEWCEAACIYQELVGSADAPAPLLLRAANALWLSDQPEEALELYRRASLLLPDSPAPFMGLGNSLRDLNRFEAADRAFRASRQRGDGPALACNHATLLIGLESYDEAYGLAERRFELPGMGPGPEGGVAAVVASAPVLHVRTEQGLGDGLQYLRWIPPLLEQATARGQSVVLEVEPSLVALLRRGLAWLPQPPEVRARPEPGGDDSLGVGTGGDGLEPAPARDLVSLLSLPAALGGAPCPQPPGPDGRGTYLRGLAPAKPADGWGRPPRVGLTWASGRKLADGFTRREYRKRTLPAAALVRLVEGLVAQGWEPVLLQQGEDREMAEPVAPLFGDAIPPDGDFLATAGVLASTDLLITVDTAMAHLAGAMGHPAWVLLPFSADPRWLRQRQDSPWYPSLRLFRQGEDRDWLPVVAAVLQAAAVEAAAAFRAAAAG